MISSDGYGALTPEAYDAVEIPLKDIKKMITDGTWEDSLEQEEVEYNLENNLYKNEPYLSELKKLLNKD